MKNPVLALTLIALIIILVCSSCYEQQFGKVIYVVNAKGKYAIPRNYMPQPNILNFNFTINDTWQWLLGMPFAKVYGLYWIDPEDNSVRLATRSVINGSELYMMCHVKSELVILYIGFVRNGTYDCSLGKTDTGFWLVFSDKEYNVIGNLKNLGVAALSLPYKEWDTNNDWFVPIERY